MALNNNQISSKGFWLTTDEEGHCFDQPLCEAIKNITKNKSLLDLGCGTGAYTKELQFSCTSAKGYDGNPNTLEISKGLCGVADLTKKQKFDKVDWVLSLEVGEHVPKESEDILLDNICSHSTRGIILSWAVPGQPGDGHINCQSNEYIIGKMLDKGFNIDWDLTYKLRENATLWWFKNTLMCFKKLPIPKSVTSMEKITFCIPSKSNLSYLKTCIPSIRDNASRNDHDIIVFVDSDEDGTVKWLKEVKSKYNLKYYVNPKLGEKLYGIGKAYDFCIEKSTTDIFMIFHADMMLGKNADINAYRYLNPNSVVCSTRIEPPLHPNGGEKILLDFGMYPEEFKEEEFNQYVENHLEDTKITEGIFAPWMMHKKDFLEILGGHDPVMHSCREDSDLFNRMLLAGFEFIQPWNSLVYHLTGRGAGSFDGDPERHEKWKKDMNNSTLEFIRKWGTNVNHTPLMKPIVSPVYNKCVNIINSSPQLQEALQPWFNGGRDIIVEVDGNNFLEQDFNIIQQLPLIIQDSGEIGEFKLGNLKITINNLTSIENTLIKI